MVPVEITSGKMKRFFDFTAALILLVIMAVPIVLIAILVKITSPGPVPGWPLENPPPVAGSKSPTPVVGRTGVI
jgi:hypothetical protein